MSSTYTTSISFEFIFVLGLWCLLICLRCLILPFHSHVHYFSPSFNSSRYLSVWLKVWTRYFFIVKKCYVILVFAVIVLFLLFILCSSFFLVNWCLHQYHTYIFQLFLFANLIFTQISYFIYFLYLYHISSFGFRKFTKPVFKSYVIQFMSAACSNFVVWFTNHINLSITNISLKKIMTTIWEIVVDVFFEASNLFIIQK